VRIIASILAVGLYLAPASAQGFSVTQYGPTCGPVATGSVVPQGNHERFVFTVSNAKPNTSVMNFIGTSQQNTPIMFGVACTLLTEIAFSQLHKTDSAGTYTWSHAIPYGPGGFTGQAFVQFAEISYDANNELVVRTSNGLHMKPN
jgi:hypothetical protein